MYVRIYIYVYVSTFTLISSQRFLSRCVISSVVRFAMSYAWNSVWYGQEPWWWNSSWYGAGWSSDDWSETGFQPTTDLSPDIAWNGLATEPQPIDEARARAEAMARAEATWSSGSEPSDQDRLTADVPEDGQALPITEPHPTPPPPCLRSATATNAKPMPSAPPPKHLSATVPPVPMPAIIELELLAAAPPPPKLPPGLGGAEEPPPPPSAPATHTQRGASSLDRLNELETFAPVDGLPYKAPPDLPDVPRKAPPALPDAQPKSQAVPAPTTPAEKRYQASRDLAVTAITNLNQMAKASQSEHPLAQPQVIPPVAPPVPTGAQPTAIVVWKDAWTG